MFELLWITYLIHSSLIDQFGLFMSLIRTGKCAQYLCVEREAFKSVMVTGPIYPYVMAQSGLGLLGH